MDIELYKKRKKELNLTYDELAKISGVSRRMITGLFNTEN
jgi:DNA-binding helix-turn-helix protein